MWGTHTAFTGEGKLSCTLAHMQYVSLLLIVGQSGWLWSRTTESLAI